MTTRTVPGFLPRTAGFAFANAFPHVPVRRIRSRSFYGPVRFTSRDADGKDEVSYMVDGGMLFELPDRSVRSQRGGVPLPSVVHVPELVDGTP